MRELDLKRIAGGSDAVFAIDRHDRIIVWNKACERLLEHPASEVLGRQCWDVLGGRDTHGNVHCYANCPVMHQLRRDPDEPLHRFTLETRTARGETRNMSVSAFLLDASNTTLGVIVHVLRERPQTASSLELRLRELSADTACAPHPTQTCLEELTPRECQVLRCLAQGTQTNEIAEELGIAVVTVRNHVRTILQKLGVHTRFAAVAYAYRAGIAAGDDA